jgi:hypothetical protein
MASPVADVNVRDTVGKLYGLSGYCRTWPALVPRIGAVLIATRGGDSSMVSMRPLRRLRWPENRGLCHGAIEESQYR